MPDRSMSALASSRFPFRFWLPSLLVAISGLLGSYALWRHQQSSTMAMAEMRLEQEASAFTQAIQRRFQSYMDILSGLQGVLKLNPQLQRRDFERLVGNMEL
ncbi:hypothetical protein [Diaphorobacter aerolatus]|uniref:hypothetical protein n=1 Tax=Diaphorobacter aerolatus TaxID=1288495 RepID=UPI00299F626E|nr:hypothetical protein [Diaphorobacter aerolatus]